MSYSGTMISDLIRISDSTLSVTRELPLPCDRMIMGEETGWECGKPAVGSDIASMGPRCQECIHVQS